MAGQGEKQSANQVTLYKAREVTCKEIDANAVFKTREPNSFSDFGAEYTMVSRRPFSPSRQRKKGNITDRDDTAGFNEDLTQENMKDVLDGFLFANLREKPSTAVTAATAGTNTFTVADETGIVAGSLVLLKGMSDPSNNGLKVVASNAAGAVVVTDITVDETGSTGTMEVVGFEFPAADLSLEAPTGAGELVSATLDMTTFGLIPGEWLFVGGDDNANQIGDDATKSGYIRIAKDGVQTDRWRFDKATFVVAADDGAGDTVRVFFGTVLKNESDPDDIVKLTDHLERPLGRDADGRMSEVIKGATPNEVTWNSPLANLVNLDVSYIGMEHEKRPGTVGILAGSGTTTLEPSFCEDAFNTTSNLFRARMAIVDEADMNVTPLFAKVTEWTMSIVNNITPDKAQGVLGAFDTTEGLFEVDGEFTAYFRDMNAIIAIENNADVTFDAIYSKDNAAIIMDVPLISLGGGRPDIELDQAIFIPLETAASESPLGHTILFNWLSYVPDLGVASA